MKKVVHFKVKVDMSDYQQQLLRTAMKFMIAGMLVLLSMLLIVALVGFFVTPAKAAEPTNPQPLTFTTFLQLMKIEHKIEPGVHKIYLTWQQKKTTSKISYPMFAPPILCAQFPELAGQTLIVAAFGETEMVHTCD